MISDLFSYLVKEVASFEFEGVRSKASRITDEFFDRLNLEKDKMLRPVVEDFFVKVEAVKQRFLKQLSRLFLLASGTFLVAFGAGNLIDTALNTPGIGHVGIGLVMIFIYAILRD